MLHSAIGLQLCFCNKLNESLFVFLVFPLAEMPIVMRNTSLAKAYVTGIFVYQCLKWPPVEPGEV